MNSNVLIQGYYLTYAHPICFHIGYRLLFSLLFLIDRRLYTELVLEITAEISRTVEAYFIRKPTSYATSDT